MGARLPLIHHVSRVLLQALMSGAAGTLFGAIAGSIIPVAGTIYGGILGALTGAASAVVVVPLVYWRDMSASWVRLISVPAVFCLLLLPVSWASMLATIMGWPGAGGDLINFFVAAGFFGSLALYLSTAVWCRVRLPRAWPQLPEGCCEACGYSLQGLRGGLCPECGADRVSE